MARAKVYRWRTKTSRPWMYSVRNDAGRFVAYDEADTHAEAMALACFWLSVMRQFDDASKEG